MIDNLVNSRVFLIIDRDARFHSEGRRLMFTRRLITDDLVNLETPNEG